MESESAISVVEPRIRALLSAYPQMPATVIAEPIQHQDHPDAR
jgi:hypothetical protein